MLKPCYTTFSNLLSRMRLLAGVTLERYRLAPHVMNLHIPSDLHTEFADISPPRTDADVVILAGDIGVGRAGMEWTARCFPEQPVIYVPGNHGYYGYDIGFTNQLKAAAPQRWIASVTTIRMANAMLPARTCIALFILVTSGFALRLQRCTCQDALPDRANT
jgi:hypothetical protein